MNRKQYKIGDRIGGELKVLEVFGGAGKSGMGVVYLVEDREANFPYVLKTLQYSPITSSAKQFMTEAKSWIQIGQHENIVQAFWVREIDQQLFIAAEYVRMDSEGRNTITDYIKEGPAHLAVLINFGVQFCYGMEFAKNKGLICHRDIKPDNLMVDPNFTLKITDFGLAKLKAIQIADFGKKKVRWPFKKKTGYAKYEMTGTVLGTPPYMAPEQFIDAKTVDHRADIYSFGIVLFELLSGGCYPYQIKQSDFVNPMADFARLHLYANPIKIESPLMEIIQRCLQKNRNQRYKSFQNLLSDLKQVAKDKNIFIIEAPEIIPSLDTELYMKAQSYVALKEPDKALNAIEAYVANFPNRYCGWTEKSKIHLERNEIDQAIEAAGTSLSLNPYNSHAWNNLGLAMKRQGSNLIKAKLAYEKAIKYDKHNTGAMANLSALLMELKEYDKIPDLLITALKLRPKKETLCFNAGNIAALLIGNNRLSYAKDILEALTKASPNNLNAWHNLALINWQQDKLQEAISCFENVVRLNPSDDFAWLSLVKLYFRSKNAKKTVYCCNKLIKMDKSVVAAISMSAQVLNFTGDYPGAVTLIESYLQRQPENDMLWFVLSEIHEFQDNRDAALKAAKQCKNILMKYEKKSNPENIIEVEEKIERLSHINPTDKF